MNKNTSIDRDELCGKLAERLRASQQVLLHGPAQWGKTSLARQIQEQYCLAGEQKVIYLDFFALRHQFSDALDFAVIRWLLEDEAKYQQFIRTHRTQQKKLLQAYIGEHLQQGGLLIVDHMEVVHRSQEIFEWFKRLSLFLEKQGFRTLWIERVADYASSLLYQARIREPDTVEITPLSEQEIAVWLEKIVLKKQFESCLNAAEIFSVTQGSPSITKHILGYFQDSEERAPSLAHYQIQSNKQYLVSCQRVWQALTEHPGEIETWRHSPSDRLRNKLWLSGAFKREPDGGLTELSPIHKKRLEGLLLKDRFLSALANQPVSEIADELKQFSEIIATPLRRNIAECTADLEVFRTLRDYFLTYFRLGDVRFYLRDRGHALIWKEILVHKQGLDIGEKIFVGGAGIQHDFTRVSRSGRHTSLNKATYLFPVIGTTGQVDMICKVNLRKTRRFTYLYQCGKVQEVQQSLFYIQPVLSQRIALYSYLHDQRGSRNLKKRVEAKVFRPDESELSGVLDESKMQAVGVLKPVFEQAEQRWAIASLQSKEEATVIPDIQALLSMIDQTMLASLVEYPNSRELVIGHEQACIVFPHLKAFMGHSTLYIRPITVEKTASQSEKWIVFFIDLARKKSSRNRGEVILGYQQQMLFFLAERAFEIVYRGGRQRVFMSALLRGIDHELKHYIKDIAWEAELLKDELGSTELRAQCETIESKARLMSKRIDRVKQLAQTNKGKQQRLNVRETAGKIIKEVLSWAGQPDLQAVPIEFEGIDRNAYIKIDRGQFRMALENLLRNAQEAVASVEQPLISVFTEERSQRRSRVELVVSDNGPGLKNVLEGNLFDPFITGHAGLVPDGEPDRARGVGLTLVRNVVHLAGGEVTYQRVNGKTRFEMSLPKG